MTKSIILVLMLTAIAMMLVSCASDSDTTTPDATTQQAAPAHDHIGGMLISNLPLGEISNPPLSGLSYPPRPLYRTALECELIAERLIPGGTSLTYLGAIKT